MSRGYRRPLRAATRKADPVTAEVREAVLRRDGRCVASILEPGHECRDMYGTTHHPSALSRMTLDHLRLDPGGKRRSLPSQLVTLCYGAHIATGWATANRPALRDYLARVRDPHAEHVDPCGAPECPAARRVSA